MPSLQIRPTIRRIVALLGVAVMLSLALASGVLLLRAAPSKTHTAATKNKPLVSSVWLAAQQFLKDQKSQTQAIRQKTGRASNFVLASPFLAPGGAVAFNSEGTAITQIDILPITSR